MKDEYEKLSDEELAGCKVELESVLEEQALKLAELNRVFARNKVELRLVQDEIRFREFYGRCV